VTATLDYDVEEISRLSPEIPLQPASEEKKRVELALIDDWDRQMRQLEEDGWELVRVNRMEDRRRGTYRIFNQLRRVQIPPQGSCPQP
jgi:hypothetical protein